MKWYRTTEYYLNDAWRTERQRRGVTIQHAFHYIDLLQYLAGPAESVEARMTNLGHPKIQIEDTLDALIRFQNGVIGSVTASTALWPGTDVRVDLFGEKGAAVMQGTALSLWKFQEERPEDEAIRRCGDPTQATASSSPTAAAERRSSAGNRRLRRRHRQQPRSGHSVRERASRRGDRAGDVSIGPARPVGAAAAGG